MFPFMLCFVLGASSSIWLMASPVTPQLPLCRLVNQTLSLEKKGCPRCLSVVTTICGGHCITKDPNIPMPYRMRILQNVCTYRDFYSRKADLPGCLPGVNPTVTYPVAVSCHCSGCVTERSDCTTEGTPPTFCSHDEPLDYSWS